MIAPKRILACIVLALIITPIASSQTIHGKIPITSTIEAIKFTAGGQVRQYLLWNKEESPRPIGHAFVACRYGPGSVAICTSIYSLPYGKITTTAEVHNYGHYSGVITGGSRSQRAKKDGHPGYLRIIGTVATVRIGPGTYSVIFVLE